MLTLCQQKMAGVNKYYFGIDYKERLYPAAGYHGFLHPNITLPSQFCSAGIERFKKEMDSIPIPVRTKIIDTLRFRIQDKIKEGINPEDAKRMIIPSSLDYLLK